MPRGKAQGWGEDGGVSVVVPGTQGSGSQRFQRSFASCTITVYAAGTVNLSTIYSDNAGTAKANPFTAASDGQWFFYADNGSYDIKFTGGGIPAPFTLGAVYLNAELNKGVFNVMEFGATGNGVTDDTAAIQAAMDAIPYTGGPPQGGVVLLPPGKYKVSSALKVTRPGVALMGQGMYTGPGENNGFCATLLATAAHPGPVFQADPIDSTVGVSFHLRGVFLSNLTIDVTANPTMAIVIKLRSCSNMPVWSNVTIFGNAGTALDIGTSAQGGAQVSEGLQFENFYDYAGYIQTGNGQYVGAQAAPLLSLVAANEVLFHGGKWAWNGTVENAAFPMMLIQSDAAGVNPAYAITFDGVSTSSNYIHYRVHGVTNVSPNWVRWENCTLENFNIGIAINDVSVPAVASQALYVSKSTRFFGTIGATPKIISANWVSTSVFYHDNFNGSGAAPLVFGANATGNLAIGPYFNVTDNGANSWIDSSILTNAFVIQPNAMVRGGTNPYFQVVNTTGGAATAQVQATATQALLGSSSAHDVGVIVGGNVRTTWNAAGGFLAVQTSYPGFTSYAVTDTNSGIQAAIVSGPSQAAVGAITNNDAALVVNNSNMVTAHTAGNGGGVEIHTPAAAPAALLTSSIQFYLDEVGNNLKVICKYSNGATVKTGTIAIV